MDTAMTRIENQNIASWDGFAPDFRERATISSDDVHYGLCIPGEHELALLPDVDGRRALDVGCGGGENCIAISKRGAEVVGLEPAHSFFEVAERATADRQNIVVLNRPWGDEQCHREEPFHLVMFIGSSEYFALDNQFFHRLNRHTRVGSFTILARIHPFWSALFLHECGEVDVRNYYTQGRTDAIQYGHGQHVMQRYHYSLEYMVSGFAEAGWQLDRILEPRPVPASRAPFHMQECYGDDLLVQRMSSIPMHLILRLRREKGG